MHNLRGRGREGGREGGVACVETVGLRACMRDVLSTERGETYLHDKESSQEPFFVFVGHCKIRHVQARDIYVGWRKKNQKNATKRKRFLVIRNRKSKKTTRTPTPDDDSVLPRPHPCVCKREAEDADEVGEKGRKDTHTHTHTHKKHTQKS